MTLIVIYLLISCPQRLHKVRHPCFFLLVFENKEGKCVYLKKIKGPARGLGVKFGALGLVCFPGAWPYTTISGVGL